MPLTAGTRLGPYEVLAPLGAGGMGEVYRAHDSKLGRDVALKILPDAFAQDPERLARFKREAHVLAALNHPNIAAIYGLEDAGPVHALVLELVEGPTLAEVIGSGLEAHGSGPGSASSPKPQAPSLSDALHIARQIVDALEAAHAQGIIHRDLKPANVKVRPDGTVKVLDFGLAKALGSDRAGPSSSDLTNSPTMTSPAMTALGLILGTAAYMSPEQAKGRPVDKRADIWAFGCVLYEMVTGHRAFEGDDVSDTLASILKSDPDWSALPADTPAALRRLLRRCLSKDLAGRLSDIGVARLEIADALAPPDTSADRAGAAPVAVAPPPRSRWPLVGLAAAILALISVSPLLIRHLREAPVTPLTVRFTIGPPAGLRIPPGASGARATVSPDGRLVVFRAQRLDGLPRLWVRALDTLEARELAGTDNANRPFWSPDSRFIAFGADGKLKKIEASGGPVQTVTDCSSVGWGSWGPGVILYVCGGAILRVPEAGGQGVAATTLDDTRKETSHGSPQLLPDGRRFLFTAQPGNVVFLASLDSPTRTQLLAGDTDVRYASAGYLLFTRQGTLMAQPFDPSRATLSGTPVPLAERVLTTGGFQHVSISETGTLTYESAVDQPGGVPVWVDRRGAELGLAAAGAKDIMYPRLSPDGHRLAAVSRGDVWVYDLQGRPEIKLTRDGTQVEHYAPLWSPDGQSLVYESTAPAPLRSLPADGSNSTPTVVSPEGHFHPHGWLPDSHDLLAVRVGGVDDADIVALAPGEKSEPRVLVATPSREGFDGAALSPDGHWLAYASNSTGRQEIWVRPYPGPGAPVRVSPNGGVEPVWMARTGRELFYLEGNRMMSVAVHPGTEMPFAAPVLLFESTYLHVALTQPPSYDVASDGRFLMLKAPAGSDSSLPPFTVVMNWVDELKRRTQGR